MAATFDPYHRWLGIGPKDQPPNHYRLLGLEIFESDPDVIENAADRQMRHVRGFQSGERAEVSQQILNEIAAAKLCLLSSDDKLAYDKQLKAKTKKPKKSRALATAQPLAKPEVPPVSLQAQPFKPVVTAEPSSPATGSVPLLLLLAIGGAGIGLLMLAGIVVWASGLLTTPEEVPVDVAVSPPPIVEPNLPLPSPPPRPNPRIDIPSRPKPPDPRPPVVDPPQPRPPVVRPTDPSPPREEPVSPDPKPDPNKALLALLNDGPAEKDGRHPVPSEDVRTAKREVIEELFPTSGARTTIEKSELAKKLLQTGKDTSKDPAAQFVLYNMARELAADGGDSSVALEAVDLLDASFQVDGNQMRIDSIAAAAKVSSPKPVRTQTVKDGIALVDRLFHDDQYVEAGRLVAGLSSVARYLRDRELIDALNARRDAGRDMFAAYQEVQSDIERFREEPGDEDAALNIGKYFAFAKGDWQRGLPFLAAGRDDTLKSLAEAEMAVPSSSSERKQLGDSWYDSAGNHVGLAADRQKARAAMWYSKIENSVSGLTKVEVSRRLKEIASIGLDGGEIFQRPTAVAASDPLVGRPLPPGEVDLLAMVDVAKDSANGVWTRQGQDIVAPSTYFARLSLPCLLPDEYVLDLEVTGEKPALDAAVGLTSGDKQFSAIVEGFNDSTSSTSCSGLGDIDRKRPTANETQRRGRWSKPGEKNHLRVEVRSSVIRVTLNDEVIIEWRGNHSRLTRSAFTYVDDARRPYLGSHGQKLIYHSAKLTPISGEVRMLRAGDTVAQPSADVIDLLSKVDLRQDRLSGTWRMERGALTSPTTYGAIVKLPAALPAEYKITLEVERKQGQNALLMGLMARGNAFQALLGFKDGRPQWGYVNALEDVAGGRVTDPRNTTTTKGDPFRDDGASTVVYSVMNSGITVTCDGKLIIEYSGDPSKLTLPGYWAAKLRGHKGLWIGTYGCSFAITRIELQTLSGSAVPAERGHSVDLLALVDTNKNAFNGTWKKEGGNLVSSTQAFSRIQVPYSPPEEYDLQVDLTRISGQQDISIGLVYRGKQCHVALDRYNGKQSDLMVDMRTNTNGVARFSGKAIDVGERHTVTCEVRKDHVRVLLGDKELLTYRGEPSWSGMNEFWRVSDRDALMVGAHQTLVHIHAIKLTPVK